MHLIEKRGGSQGPVEIDTTKERQEHPEPEERHEHPELETAFSGRGKQLKLLNYIVS